ncbi:MAG: S66 peptidase family protein [Brevinema sp.]
MRPLVDTLAIVSPASAANKTLTEKGIAILESRGLTVLRSPHWDVDYQGYGGTVAQQIEDLHWAFTQASAQVVICSRGGYGSIRLLEYLDYNLIRNNPKVFIGYSDITSLHMAFIAKCGLKTLHAPMISSDIAGKAPESLDNMLDFLYSGVFKSPSFSVLRHGTANGVVLGGNLSVFMASLGSDFMPNLEGCLLFIEDINEPAYKIDRMLRTLRNAKVLSRLSGLLVGDIHDGSDNPEEYQAYVLESINENTRDISIPVITGLKIGHCSPNFSLPLGVRMSLDTHAGSLTLIENFLSK